MMRQSSDQARRESGETAAIAKNISALSDLISHADTATQELLAAIAQNQPRCR